MRARTRGEGGLRVGDVEQEDLQLQGGGTDVFGEWAFTEDGICVSSAQQHKETKHRILLHAARLCVLACERRVLVVMFLCCAGSRTVAGRCDTLPGSILDSRARRSVRDHTCGPCGEFAWGPGFCKGGGGE